MSLHQQIKTIGRRPSFSRERISWKTVEWAEQNKPKDNFLNLLTLHINHDSAYKK